MSLSQQWQGLAKQLQGSQATAAQQMQLWQVCSSCCSQPHTAGNPPELVVTSSSSKL
jgi:hypothetical protein